MSATRLIPPVGAGDHVWGPENPPVTLVAYGDFECVFCGMVPAVLRAAGRQVGSMMRFAFRHFPLSAIHPHARLAAQAAEAAGAQGRFREMHDYLLTHQRALKHEDLVGHARALGLDVPRFAGELRAGTHAARVSRDYRSGVASGVSATPTFFVNGERYDGSWTDIPSFIRAIRDAARGPIGAGPLDGSDTS